MKKTTILVLALIVSVVLFTGCNKAVFDTVKSFDRAIISLPNGTIIEGEVQNWTDFADGDQIQVKINDIYYLVHSSDIALIAE